MLSREAGRQKSRTLNLALRIKVQIIPISQEGYLIPGFRNLFNFYKWFFIAFSVASFLYGYLYFPVVTTGTRYIQNWMFHLIVSILMSLADSVLLLNLDYSFIWH